MALEMVRIGCFKMLNMSMFVLHRTLVIKSRRCLSVKVRELLRSFCRSCVESVKFGYLSTSETLAT